MTNLIFLCVVIGAFGMLPVILISYRIKNRPAKRQRFVEEAKRRQHVVTARLVRCVYPAAGERKGSDKEYTAFYEYEYGGKQYRYRILSYSPPDELTLYFMNDPRQAVTEGDIATKGGFKPGFLIIYIIAVVIVAMVIANH